jgi:hypothetical protein
MYIIPRNEVHENLQISNPRVHGIAGHAGIDRSIVRHGYFEIPTILKVDHMSVKSPTSIRVPGHSKSALAAGH